MRITTLVVRVGLLMHPRADFANGAVAALMVASALAALTAGACAPAEGEDPLGDRDDGAEEEPGEESDRLDTAKEEDDPKEDAAQEAEGGNAGAGGRGGAGGSTRLDAGSTADVAPMLKSSLKDESIVWNGDGVGDGRATQWMGRGQEGKTTLTFSTADAFSKTHSIAFKMANINYGEFGWGIKSTPAKQYRYLAFWTRRVLDPGKSGPGDAFVTVRIGGTYAAPGGGRGVRTITYNKTSLQGQWQQVVIPVADIVGNASGNITELLIGLGGCGTPACSFTLYVDDIAFGN